MSAVIQEAFPAGVEINISDIMPDDGDPRAFHQSMLDDVNAEARRQRWRGVTIGNVGWNKETRILSLCCLRGRDMADLAQLHKVIQAQKAAGFPDDGLAKGGPA